jgi:hypothetical protein
MTMNKNNINIKSKNLQKNEYVKIIMINQL